MKSKNSTRSYICAFNEGNLQWCNFQGIVNFSDGRWWRLGVRIQPRQSQNINVLLVKATGGPTNILRQNIFWAISDQIFKVNMMARSKNAQQLAFLGKQRLYGSFYCPLIEVNDWWYGEIFVKDSPLKMWTMILFQWLMITRLQWV